MYVIYSYIIYSISIFVGRGNPAHNTEKQKESPRFVLWLSSAHDDPQ